MAGYYIPDMRASSGFGLPPRIKRLNAELMKRGFEHVLEAVDEARKRDPAFQLAEADVNAWGYGLLELGQTKRAIEVFKLNISLYPGRANTYDSLADGYSAGGDKTLAISNYKRLDAKKLPVLRPEGYVHERRGEDCHRIATIFAQNHCDTCEAVTCL